MEIKKTKLYESLANKTIGDTNRPVSLTIKANSNNSTIVKNSGSRKKTQKSCGGCSGKKK